MYIVRALQGYNILMFKKYKLDNLQTLKRFSAFAIIEIVDVESKLHSYWLLRLSIAYFESFINVLVLYICSQEHTSAEAYREAPGPVRHLPPPDFAALASAERLRAHIVPKPLLGDESGRTYKELIDMVCLLGLLAHTILIEDCSTRLKSNIISTPPNDINILVHYIHTYIS